MGLDGGNEDAQTPGMDDLTAAELAEIAELESEARECGADPLEYALIVALMSECADSP